jgi:hypothetical protein
VDVFVQADVSPTVGVDGALPFNGSLRPAAAAAGGPDKAIDNAIGVAKGFGGNAFLTAMPCHGRLCRQKGFDAMNNANSEFDLQESDILTVEITDEALEIAACPTSGMVAAFTVAMCTGNLECPF